MKMSKADKQEWIAALRSGEYKQGRGFLARKGLSESSMSFCCLGVLCELNSEKGEVLKETRAAEIFERNYYHGDSSYLPIPLTNKYKSSREGFSIHFYALSREQQERLTKYYTEEVDEADSIPKSFSIAQLNDRGFSFLEIADLIEKHVEITD